MTATMDVSNNPLPCSLTRRLNETYDTSEVQEESALQAGAGFARPTNRGQRCDAHARMGCLDLCTALSARRSRIQQTEDLRTTSHLAWHQTACPRIVVGPCEEPAPAVRRILLELRGVVGLIKRRVRLASMDCCSRPLSQPRA